MEVLVHRSGYRPNIDALSCHARHRYHIIGKAPHVADDIDPNLWIIHYGPAEPQYRMPIQQIRLHPEQQRIISERAFIESKGPLQRKEFMLYDAAQWPTVNFGAQMQHQIAQRGPPFYQAPPGADDPRVKRPRVEPPAAGVMGRQRGPSMAVQFDPSLEDEENAQLGDFLDHLTPREISTLRFKQHHEWFEEIFSSVYGTAQILPEDLGLGLAGDLDDLTRGILDTPGAQSEKAADKQPLVKRDEPVRSYQKLDKEKMDDLDKRITEYIEKGQAEIRAVKAEHAKKLQDPKRNAYRVAERKLREAGRVPNPTGAVSEVVRQVESELNISLVPKKDFTCVDKGGLEEEKKAAPPLHPTNGTNGDVNGVNGSGIFNGMGGDSHSLGTNDNSAAGLLDQFASGSYGNTPRSDGARISTPHIPQDQSAAGTPAEAAAAADTEQQNDFEMQEGDTGLDNAQEGSGLDFLEDMDLDAPLGEDDAGDEVAMDKPAGGEDDWVMINQNDDNAPTEQATTAAGSESVPTTQQQEQPTVQPTEPAAADAAVETTGEEDVAAADDQPADTDAVAGDADDDIFGDITGDGDNFNDFDIDDTAGDELADYTGGHGGEDDLGLDLDNSTFDDAFQATDLDNNQDQAEDAGV